MLDVAYLQNFIVTATGTKHMTEAGTDKTHTGNDCCRKCDCINHEANKEYKVPPTSKCVEMSVAIWSYKNSNFKVTESKKFEISSTLIISTTENMTTIYNSAIHCMSYTHYYMHINGQGWKV